MFPWSTLREMGMPVVFRAGHAFFWVALQWRSPVVRTYGLAYKSYSYLYAASTRRVPPVRYPSRRWAKKDRGRLEPFQTAVPFSGQTTRNVTINSLAPKLDCGFKRVQHRLEQRRKFRKAAVVFRYTRGVHGSVVDFACFSHCLRRSVDCFRLFVLFCGAQLRGTPVVCFCPRPTITGDHSK